VSEDAEAVARAWLTRVAAHSPAAYAATKADLRRGATTVAAADHERFYGDLVPRLWASAEVRERLLAVIGG
jgi:enoyl-CoA hydratase/carnithine racemase